MNEIPVIFRKWKDNDIVAIFPTLLGTNDPYSCQMYEHVGQHGAGDPFHVIGQTAAAKPKEYASLLKELHQIGYRGLKIYNRYQNRWTNDRIQEMRRINTKHKK
jgi:hypothetical protein